MQILEGHTGIVISLCYSADGALLVSGGKDGQLLGWEVEMATSFNAPATEPIQSIATNEQGDWLIGTGAEWYQLAPSKTTARFNRKCQPEKVRRDIGATTVAFLDNDILVIGYGNRTKPEPGAVELWTTDLTIRKQPHFHAPYGVRSLATHPSGCIAWTEWGSRTETGPRLFIWEITQPDRYRHGLANECGQLAFHPEGRLLALTSSWQIALFDRKHNSITAQLTGHKGNVSSVAFHPDGRTLASGSWDKTIRIWDVETWTEVRSFRSMVGKIHALTYSPDGLQLAAGGDSGGIMVIDTE